VEPIDEVKVPAAQRVQAVAVLLDAVKLPAAHDEQTVLRDAMHAWLAKLPAAQVEQAVQFAAPAADQLPALQALHDVAPADE
jgi:hypothetical protein